MVEFIKFEDSVKRRRGTRLNAKDNAEDGEAVDHKAINDEAMENKDEVSKSDRNEIEEDEYYLNANLALDLDKKRKDEEDSDFDADLAMNLDQEREDEEDSHSYTGF